MTDEYISKYEKALHETPEYKNLRLISLQLPEGYIREINRLVKSGEYPTRSEFIRQAVRLLLLKHNRKMNKYKSKMMYA